MVDNGGEAGQTVKITVRQSSGEQFEVDIALSATVLQLKEKCKEKINLEPASQRLIYKGKSHFTLSSKSSQQWRWSDSI